MQYCSKTFSNLIPGLFEPNVLLRILFSSGFPHIFREGKDFLGGVRSVPRRTSPQPLALRIRPRKSEHSQNLPFTSLTKQASVSLTWRVLCPSSVCNSSSQNRNPSSYPKTNLGPWSSWLCTSRCPPSRPTSIASIPDSAYAFRSSLRSATDNESELKKKKTCDRYRSDFPFRMHFHWLDGLAESKLSNSSLVEITRSVSVYIAQWWYKVSWGHVWNILRKMANLNKICHKFIQILQKINISLQFSQNNSFGD